MKKIFSLVFVLTLLASSTSFAQLKIDKGTKLINAGIGLGGGYYSGGGIGFVASADFGVVPNITVGATAGYHSYGNAYASYNYHSIEVGARGSYHFNELLNLTTDKVDLYAGLGLSYYSLSYGGYIDSYGAVYVPFHLGGRYFFSDKVGGFAELGSTINTLKLGVTFKL